MAPLNHTLILRGIPQIHSDRGLVSHYDKVAAYLHDLSPDDQLRLRFYDESNKSLTPEAMAGDRAMRESGFDASMQMGYFGLETLDYNPTCLNSLLYVQCQILGYIYKKLDEPEKAHHYHSEAFDLCANIQKYLWNEEVKLFCNYNGYLKQSSPFYYITCVYPLWGGIATAEQAKHFHDNLALFETSFGLKGTDRQTGCQWDAPFMWAPLVYFAVAGLHRYGFVEDARRIANKFVDTVRRVYEETGANFEKYNAETGDKKTEDIIEVGYSENVVGFGWTNGAVVMLQEWLKKTANIIGTPVVDTKQVLVHFPHFVDQM